MAAGVRHLTVGADEAEQRLDRWMRRRFPTLKQGRIEKMCRRGEIRIDGARARSASRVTPGQVVRVPPMPEAAEETGPDTAAPRPTQGDVEMLRRAVLYRDRHLIAVNKPPGLAVQGGSGQTRHLDAMLSALAGPGEDAPRLVHRLDRDTSGVLLLARTEAAASALTKAFRGRGIGKTYLALVSGVPHPSAGTIRLGLVKAGGRGAPERMQTVHPDAIESTPGARPAVTDYRVLERSGRRAAWVALRPRTGRTHQLRVHMAALGSPIVGDGKYGGRGAETRSGRGAGLGEEISRRLHLHAARLELAHPVTEAPLRLVAPLPGHMVATGGFLGWTPDPEDVDLAD